jgi:hypothetical protein
VLDMCVCNGSELNRMHPHWAVETYWERRGRDEQQAEKKNDISAMLPFPASALGSIVATYLWKKHSGLSSRCGSVSGHISLEEGRV